MIFLNLQNKCKEWRVVFFTLDSVRDDPDSEEYWAYLERICSNSVGHICNLLVFKGQGSVKLDSLRKAWKISDMLNIYVDGVQTIHLRGGGGLDDLEADWQYAVEALH